ncbi:hypothetical protein D5125_02535 [Magnetovirga frankeli]|uniref:hypothetical protein n=1 Tax=Magnetovirga frankeli TaxID=947516 RepID=UPI0012931735|nr:hypothetical protein D5125_02535 [gamma proteobacterium SS-5]
MASAKNQQKWRNKTNRRRVEVYLPEDLIQALDRLGQGLGLHSRAETLKQLIEQASQGVEPIQAPPPVQQAKTAEEAGADRTSQEQQRLARFYREAERFVDIEHQDGDDRIGLRAAVHRHQRPEQLGQGAEERYTLICRQGETWRRVQALRQWQSRRLGSGWGAWQFRPKAYSFITDPAWHAMLEINLPEDPQVLARLIRDNDPKYHPRADVQLYRRALAKRQQMARKTEP